MKDVRWPPNDRAGLCGLLAIGILAALGAGAWALVTAAAALIDAVST